ncbi:MAG: hypothetical protein NVS3B21_14970 [Acidimicrobiales bacterium]
MAIRSTQIIEPAELGDRALAGLAAAGDSRAFEELYRRHADAAWGVAQAVAANPHDAADAVAEAFTRMLHALASGRLDTDVPFRPYLLVTTRNVAIDQHRHSARTTSGSEAFTVDLPATSAGPAERALDRADSTFVAEAFRGLPERWRTVLWMTEVEGIPAKEVGARLGLSPNSAAQLAARARAGLRSRYLQAHLRRHPGDPCEPTVALLGAYAAGGLTPRAIAAVDQHLAACPQCRSRVEHLDDVGGPLRAIGLPLPATLGAASLIRFRHAFPAPPAPATGFIARSPFGPGGFARSLSMSTGALLTAGVITAGLMSSAGGPSPVRSSRAGGTTALGPAPTVRPLPTETPAAIGPAEVPSDLPAQPTLTPSDPGTSQRASKVDVVPVGSTGPTAANLPPAAPSASTGSSPSPSPGTSPAGQPPSAPAPPPSPAPGTQPAAAVVQIAAGAKLGPVTTSGALGIGGGCSGLSVNGSASCAPPPPAQQGVTLTATTPAGTVGTVKPLASPALTLP